MTQNTTSRRSFLKQGSACAAGVAASQLACAASTPAKERPNIIWVVAEDQSKHYGFNGERLVTTPHLDKLAAEGVQFTQAMVTAPVCSACRSALSTGMYQTSIGAHHHRSGRGAEKIQLPAHVIMIPQYFQEAGYYTTLGSIGHIVNPGENKRLGKSDYNFEWDESIIDSNEWSGRAEGQPFFAQIMISGGKARTSAAKDKKIPHVNPDNVTLPPYYPDHPVIKEDWAAYLDTFSQMDYQVGQLMERLTTEGILDNTVIFYITDHGVSHARGKQYVYDEGIMIPLVIYAPGRIEKAGTVRDDLVAHIDLAATSMYFAGIDIPDYLESRPLYGPDYKPRDYVVSARDRCDETVDRLRSVRTNDFKYIRNGFPKRPHLQPCVYKDEKDIYKALRQWQQEGKLNELQERLLFAPERATEELYDLKNDPWETLNIAEDKAQREALVKMRGMLDGWIQETGDNGQQPESMSMYDSDMEAYYQSIGRNKPERVPMIKKNVDMHKRWLAEGK
jgi:arylsulfatase A-like enzyme